MHRQQENNVYDDVIMLLIITQVICDIYVYGSLKIDVDLLQQYTDSTSHSVFAYGFHSYPKTIECLTICRCQNKAVESHQLF